MMLSSRQPTTWRLTLEPSGVDVAWSLLRAHGMDLAEALAGGVIRGAEDEAALTFGISPVHAPGGALELADNPLVNPETEPDICIQLGGRLIPSYLRSTLCRTDPDPGREPAHRLQIATRGWLSHVPWEALVVDPGSMTRLVETVALVSAMSPGIAATRARTSPESSPLDPGLAVIDAGPPMEPAGGSALIYPGGYPQEIVGPGGFATCDTLAPAGHPMSAHDLSEILTSNAWSRFLYLGHIVAGRHDDPAAAALVFQEKGLLQRFTAHQWLSEPERWPAPSRVALIGCGSDDAQFLEASGLPVAAVNAGAELVTCTKWTLPADTNYGRHRPTTELALAVHRAHQEQRPLAAIRAWQLTQLDEWRRRPSASSSPLYWASLTSYRGSAG